MLFLVILVITTMTIHGSEVVDLNSKNFEKLTQAATGATTGDWLVKFYAPWCGHCKKLEPIWEEVADELKGVINVARVDVMASRDLGTRFSIEGQVYTYQGKRSKEALVDFARGGYAITKPLKVPDDLGWFGEIMFVYRHAYNQAAKDLHAGNYFTIDVLLTTMPVIFIILMLVVIFIPMGDLPQLGEDRRTIPNPRSRVSPTRPVSSHAAPPTSVPDNPNKDD